MAQDTLTRKILDVIQARATRPIPKDYAQTTLLELGFDSLAAVELQLDLEVLLGRPLGPDDVASREGLSQSVGALIERAQATGGK